MTRARFLWTVAALAALLWAALSPAQNTPAPTPAPNTKPKVAAKPAAGGSQQKKKDERIVIEWADRLTQEGDIYHLRGNVVFAREDMKLYCDEADYDEKADTAKARGHLRITDPNSVITGDLLDADFNKELAIVTGNVTIVTQKKENQPSPAKPEGSLEKPKGQAAGAAANANTPTPDTATPGADKPKDENGKEPEHFEDYWKKKSTITCERVEYYYADDVKKMIATPRVKAVQEDKTAWADTAVFEDLARTVTLTGNVVVTNEKGDEMRCAKAVIWIDEDRAEAVGASGVTLRKKKDEPAKPAPAETPPAPAPTPAKPEGTP